MLEDRFLRNQENFGESEMAKENNFCTFAYVLNQSYHYIGPKSMTFKNMGGRTVGQDRQKCKETSNLDVIVMDMDTA